MITLKRRYFDGELIEVYIRKRPSYNHEWNYIGRRFTIYYNDIDIGEVYWHTLDRCWNLTGPAHGEFKSKDRSTTVLYAVMRYLRNGNL